MKSENKDEEKTREDRENDLRYETTETFPFIFHVHNFLDSGDVWESA